MFQLGGETLHTYGMVEKVTVRRVSFVAAYAANTYYSYRK